MKNSLGELALSRDNHFQLLRLCAAGGVFVSHCFPLAGFGATGKAALLGFISLNVFFIVSGFLITRSFFARSDPVSFIRSRILRIYPALIVAVLFCVFLIGPAFTNQEWSDYFSDPAIYDYLIKNSFLFWPGIPESLPGVFLDSAYRPIVNAPLWSLPYEVWCYTALFVSAMLLGAKKAPRLYFSLVGLVFVFFFGVFALNYSLNTTEYAVWLGKDAYRLGAMFMLGMLFYSLKNHIRISLVYAALIVVAIAVADQINATLYAVVAYAGLGYLVMCFAYAVKGPLLRFNSLGDYSYGIYIFGYPVQQAVEHIAPDLSLPVYFLVSLSITFLCAAFSWHLIEKRALLLKS